MKPGNPFEEGKRLLKDPAADDCCVDLVLVISASQSMKVFWSAFSQEADALAGQLMRQMIVKMRGKSVRLRIRVIAYRDLYMDSSAMQCSPFYEMPREADRLAEFVRSVESIGGGAEKKSGLEALHCAMHSPWTRGGADRRHVVAVITDSAAYIPEEPIRRIDREYDRRLRAHLPEGAVPMPETMDELRRLWRDGAGTMDNWKHRLLIIASDKEPWEYIKGWDEAQLVRLPQEQIRRLGAAALSNSVIGVI